MDTGIFFIPSNTPKSNSLNFFTEIYMILSKKNSQDKVYFFNNQNLNMKEYLKENY